MSPLKKKVNPCRLSIVGMPRYQVFYLTRSELGNICSPKKELFLGEFVRPMYLLKFVDGRTLKKLFFLRVYILDESLKKTSFLIE